MGVDNLKMADISALPCLTETVVFEIYAYSLALLEYSAGYSLPLLLLYNHSVFYDMMLFGYVGL